MGGAEKRKRKIHEKKLGQINHYNNRLINLTKKSQKIQRSKVTSLNRRRKTWNHREMKQPMSEKTKGTI